MTADDLRRRIRGLRDERLAPDTLASRVGSVLREQLPHDGLALFTSDPETTLPTGGVVEGFPEWACSPFWDNELLDPDFNKFGVLARSVEPVATLADATDGDLERSPRYRRIYGPLEWVDECRAAFTLGASCWGYVALARSGGAFEPDELRLLRAQLHEIACAIRESVISAPRFGDPQPAAVVILSAGDTIESHTGGAREWLEELGGGVPKVLRIAASRARAVPPAAAPLRARGVAGRWFIVEAAALVDGGGQVAATIRPARASELVGILLERYGLTERETEIVLALARGQATKQIAGALVLSTHTVRDHFKAIFEKVGVNSRGELVAKLFSEHLLEPLHADVTMR